MYGDLWMYLKKNFNKVTLIFAFNSFHINSYLNLIYIILFYYYSCKFNFGDTAEI